MPPAWDMGQPTKWNFPHDTDTPGPTGPIGPTVIWLFCSLHFLIMSLHCHSFAEVSARKQGRTEFADHTCSGMVCTYRGHCVHHVCIVRPVLNWFELFCPRVKVQDPPRTVQLAPAFAQAAAGPASSLKESVKRKKKQKS